MLFLFCKARKVSLDLKSAFCIPQSAMDVCVGFASTVCVLQTPVWVIKHCFFYGPEKCILTFQLLFASCKARVHAQIPQVLFFSTKAQKCLYSFINCSLLFMHTQEAGIGLTSAICISQRPRKTYYISHARFGSHTTHQAMYKFHKVGLLPAKVRKGGYMLEKFHLCSAKCCESVCRFANRSLCLTKPLSCCVGLSSIASSPIGLKRCILPLQLLFASHNRPARSI